MTELLTPGANSARSTVKVKWNSGGSNVYRVGYKGKVDIQYTEESPGGECYPQHLPVFGEEGGGGGMEGVREKKGEGGEGGNILTTWVGYKGRGGK